MSKLLLDTITFDFLLTDPLKIPLKSRLEIDRADAVYLSVVSLWELGNHVRDGKFQVSINFERYFKKAIRVHGLTLLPIQWDALEYLSSFAYQSVDTLYEKTINGESVTGIKKALHKDTFDRMLIAHALTGQLQIVSPDSLFPFYKSLGLNVLWK
ncbi:type II toxin-antitoxin system VapC family toxin [Fibrella aquatilis]|uniref:Type II toxin-antitoxin system VapC family toxin n=1 Tax=Fibrella aquatilis TaxID=2817059 RepID=A0A939G0U0_9BACT|nr:type II toxin-antitoxin system VapC family toxin [Fibrella aquatilis]MBO0930327.1 type II toxin-antitoxin system VapC family toxin [Fibrella aquatilis]